MKAKTGFCMGKQWGTGDPLYSKDVLPTKQNRMCRFEHQYLTLPSLCLPTAYLGRTERAELPLENSKTMDVSSHCGVLVLLPTGTLTPLCDSPGL